MPDKFRRMMENPSEWRLRMSEIIAGKLDMDQFGVAGVYLIGSVKRFTAGPGSDIDLLIHFRGSEEQKKELKAWLKGWGECLAFFNNTLNGSATENLFDLHFITDNDIKLQTSYAVMINSVNDRAKPLKLK
jgi:predicted nucleotidyltransferase